MRTATINQVMRDAVDVLANNILKADPQSVIEKIGPGWMEFCRLAGEEVPAGVRVALGEDITDTSRFPLPESPQVRIERPEGFCRYVSTEQSERWAQVEIVTDIAGDPRWCIVLDTFEDIGCDGGENPAHHSAYTYAATGRRARWWPEPFI